MRKLCLIEDGVVPSVHELQANRVSEFGPPANRKSREAPPGVQDLQLWLSGLSDPCNVDSHGAQWGLTFDMSGGAKGAKRPLRRPLDGAVRLHASEAGVKFLPAMPSRERREVHFQPLLDGRRMPEDRCSRRGGSRSRL